MHTSKLCSNLVSKSANFAVIRSATATATAERVQVNENVPLKSWKEIPGPSSLPIIGPMLHFFPGGLFHKRNGLELTNMLIDKYGPIVRLDAFVGREPIILLYDAESSSQILRGENQFPIREGFQTLEYYRNNVKKDVKKGQPTGLITNHGDKWKELRSTVNPVLLQPKTIKLYTSVLNDVAMDMVNRMKTMRDEKYMLKGKFDQEMNLWSLESIGVVALGCRLGCLDPNLPDDSPAKQLIECIHELFLLTDKLDFKPSLWKLFSTPNYKRAMSLYALQESISKHFINKAMQEMKTKQKSDDEKGILEKLLEINEDYAHIMACDMLFAGVDTLFRDHGGCNSAELSNSQTLKYMASNTITATLYLLAVNPDKQNKLREVLRSNDEKKSYLRACLKESLRMMPIVGGNMRLTTKEYNILGYRIPPKMSIAFGHQNMSLMEEYFPRTNEYLPERWLVDKNDPLYHRNAHPFAYNPFGFGVRSCIGRRIAELEMETFTARLVENFQIEWFGPPPKVEQTSLNYVKGPFNFIFKDAPK